MEKQKTDDDGSVYTWEGFTLAEPVPLKCPVPQVGIRTVSLGRSHGAMLTLNGQLFMFGSNDRGQVGLDDDSVTIADPRLLNLPAGTEETQSLQPFNNTNNA